MTGRMDDVSRVTDVTMSQTAMRDERARVAAASQAVLPDPVQAIWHVTKTLMPVEKSGSVMGITTASDAGSA